MQNVQFNMRAPKSYQEYLDDLYFRDPVSGGTANAMTPEQYAASIEGQGQGIDLNNPFADPSLIYQGRSEEGSFIPVPGMENTYRVNMQAPGGSSRDGLEAYYQIDPATGQGTMIGEARPFRGMSGFDNFRRGIEQGVPVIAGAALGGYGLMGGSFGLGGLAGATANGAAIGAGSSAALRGDAGDVLRGGLLGGAGGAANYGIGQMMGGGTATMENTLGGYDLTPRPGIDMNSLPQPVSMPGVGSLPNVGGASGSAGGLFSPIDLASLPQPVSLPTLPELPQIGGGIKTMPGLSQGDLSPRPGIDMESLPQPVQPVPGASGGVGGTIWEAIKNNPQLAGAIGGGLLGAVDGGASGGGGGEAPYTGPMPTISRGQWKPNAQANMMQVPTFGSLLPTTGQANSGLWRFGS